MSRDFEQGAARSKGIVKMNHTKPRKSHFRKKWLYSSIWRSNPRLPYWKNALYPLRRLDFRVFRVFRCCSGSKSTASPLFSPVRMAALSSTRRLSFSSNKRIPARMTSLALLYLPSAILARINSSKYPPNATDVVFIIEFFSTKLPIFGHIADFIHRSETQSSFQPSALNATT